MLPDPSESLSDHFLLAEYFIHLNAFDQQSWDYLKKQSSLYKQSVLGNLKRHADKLEIVRGLFNQPVHINSGYRCPAINKAVGGYANSYHMKGMAADIVVADIPPATVQEILRNWLGGMGTYQTFTHLDIRPYKARWTGP